MVRLKNKLNVRSSERIGVESPFSSPNVVLVVGALLIDRFWQPGLNVALFICNSLFQADNLSPVFVFSVAGVILKKSAERTFPTSHILRFSHGNC